MPRAVTRRHEKPRNLCPVLTVPRRIIMVPPLEWNVMVYLAGDNNLSSECVYALTEIKDTLSSDRIKVFAQFDPKDDFLPTQRYEFDPGTKALPLAHHIKDSAPFKRE